jgi:hypothetical protein
MQFDRGKFKSLVHYVIARAGDRDGFGAVKLYKVLWFSDARAYMLTGNPITGETYIREKYGPLPVHALGVLEELSLDGIIRIWDDVHYNHRIRRFSSLTNPDRRRSRSSGRSRLSVNSTHHPVFPRQFGPRLAENLRMMRRARPQPKIAGKLYLR